MSHIFASNVLMVILGIVLAAFFAVLGVIGILVPWSPAVRADLVQWLLEDAIAISLFGFGFVVISLTIISNLILSMRKRYYHLRSGKNLVAIDEVVFQQYVEGYWQKLFPHYQVPHRLIFKKNTLYITADLPYVPLQQQKLLLERIRNDLSDLFNRMLGYRGEFLISASFAPRQS